MNILSNEWLEISTSQTLDDIADTFNYRMMKVLYPSMGEGFHIRLIGSLHPYYRSYVNPNYRWYEFTKNDEFKQCLLGNVDIILSVIENLIKKSKYLAERYSVDWVNKSVDYIYNIFDHQSQIYMVVEDANMKLDSEKIAFLQSCMGSSQKSSIWSPCIIANAYVRSGQRYVGSLRPVVISRSMFQTMLEAQSSSPIANSNISGINAYDLKLCRENGNKSPLLKIIASPNTLTYNEIVAITRQKLINIPEFAKSNNKQVLEAFGGFIYRPHKGIRDASETLKVLQQAEALDQNEQYEIAEKELCNMPMELVSENLFENGPISSLDIV